MEVLVETANEKKLKKLGVEYWDIWEKEVSTFEWSYSEMETCYILEGRAQISWGSESIEISEGDLVTFPEGLDCVWEIKEGMVKRYKFG